MQLIDHLLEATERHPSHISDLVRGLQGPHPKEENEDPFRAAWGQFRIQSALLGLISRANSS